MLAQVVQKSRHRENFGKLPPVASVARVCAPKPDCKAKRAGGHRAPLQAAAERQLPPGDRMDAREMNSPAVLEQDFKASGAADSANKILLEFFSDSKNFNVPFRSTDLEAMTAKAGHPSSRMNNRAIWLREQFIPRGLYLDNDPNGWTWGLPNGSYYKLCRIEDATSLTDAKKHQLTHPEPEML